MYFFRSMCNISLEQIWTTIRNCEFMHDFVNDLTKKAAHAHVMNSLWSHMRIILLAWSPKNIRNKLNYVVVDLWVLYSLCQYAFIPIVSFIRWTIRLHQMINIWKLEHENIREKRFVMILLFCFYEWKLLGSKD